MKLIVYIVLAIVMGGSVWYSFSSNDVSMEKTVNNEKSNNVQNNQIVNNSLQNKDSDISFREINMDEKKISSAGKVIDRNTINKLKELEKKAKTEAKKQEYREMQTKFKEKIDRELNSEVRYNQAKANYERQQYLAQQRISAQKAKEKYISMQQMMKNRDPKNLSKSEMMRDKTIRSYVAKENYINRQKEITERMKTQNYMNSN